MLPLFVHKVPSYKSCQHSSRQFCSHIGWDTLYKGTWEHILVTSKVLIVFTAIRSSKILKVKRFYNRKISCTKAGYKQVMIRLNLHNTRHKRKTYRMLKVYRIVIIEVKLHIRFPYDNICKVSSSNCTLHGYI